VDIDKVLFNYVNHVGEEKRQRKIGRYWSSELSGIKKGYNTPETFFSKDDIEMNGVRMILTGSAFEDMLTKIFENQEVDVSPQEKTTLQISDGVELVVKPDYVFPDFIVETKFPFSPIINSKIPVRYEYQLEAEYRAFPEKRVFLGVFSVPFSVSFIEYIPSKRRWTNIQKMLIKYDKDVRAYAKEHGFT